MESRVVTIVVNALTLVDDFERLGQLVKKFPFVCNSSHNKYCSLRLLTVSWKRMTVSSRMSWKMTVSLKKKGLHSHGKYF